MVTKAFSKRQLHLQAAVPEKQPADAANPASNTQSGCFVRMQITARQLEE
jgi:hypothetical protein